MSLFTLSQKTVEIFAANATQQAMMIHRRVNQKKNNVLKSVPLLQKMKEKITEFDQEMTKRLGKNYTKVRNIAVGVGKFYVAGQFGGPGIIVLGAINAAKAVKPLLKNAEEQRQAGKVTGLFDYMSKHPKEAGKTMASASLGAGAIVFGLAGMLDAKFVTRAAATALVVLPEMKALKETAESIIKGEKTAKQAFKDLGNDILTVGISAASFIAGNYGYLASENGASGMESATETGNTGGVSVGVKGADKPNSKQKSTNQTDTTMPPASVKNKEKSLQSTLTQNSTKTPPVAAVREALRIKTQKGL